MDNKTLSDELLDILACPACKSDLDYNKEENSLRCTKCNEKYNIKEGVPVLLPPN